MHGKIEKTLRKGVALSMGKIDSAGKQNRKTEKGKSLLTKVALQHC
jgi:hypothetical protein